LENAKAGNELRSGREPRERRKLGWWMGVGDKGKSENRKADRRQKKQPIGKTY